MRNVLAVQGYPSPSSRTTADSTASGLDLNQQVVGMDNVTGTYGSDLGQGITACGSDATRCSNIWMDPLAA